MTDIERDALTYIGGTLTPPQRRALVTSLVQYGSQERIPLLRSNEHTARVLQQGPAPLVYQEDMTRFLTPLGRAVARSLNESGAWDVSDMTSMLQVIAA